MSTRKAWFVRPLYKDWIIVVFVFLTILAWIAPLYYVIEAGGPFFTPFDIVSGLIDALTYPFSLTLIFLLPATIIRKVIWNWKQ
jgi:hypothetical protein